MKSFVILTIFAIITGALASDEHIPFNEECGAQTGVTKEQHDAFDPMGEWTVKAKKYVECGMKKGGAMVDGRFTDEFKNYIHSTLSDDASEPERAKVTTTIRCIETVESEEYEGAYEFTKCLLNSEYGQALWNRIGKKLGEA